MVNNQWETMMLIIKDTFIGAEMMA